MFNALAPAYHGMINISLGTMIVERMNRKKTWRPLKRNFANAYAAMEENSKLLTTQTAVITIELPYHRIKGYLVNTRT